MHSYIGDWVEQGWAIFIVYFFTVVILGTTWSRADPLIAWRLLLLVGNSIREYSRYLQWYLPAGVKVRKPASVRMNQMVEMLHFLTKNANQKTRLFGGMGGRLMWFGITDADGNELENHPDGEKWCKYGLSRGSMLGNHGHIATLKQLSLSNTM